MALLLLPGTSLAGIASFVLGVGSGGTLGLTLFFFGARTSTPAEAAAMSGMAQTWGYPLSAAGPIAWGAMNEATGSWTVPLLATVAVTVAMTWTAVRSAADRVVQV